MAAVTGPAGAAADWAAELLVGTLGMDQEEAIRATAAAAAVVEATARLAASSAAAGLAAARLAEAETAAAGLEAEDPEATAAAASEAAGWASEPPRTAEGLCLQSVRSSRAPCLECTR